MNATKWSGFLPKSFKCFKEGYTGAKLMHDLFAGISVGIIALPLALAFAIASGVPPERGLFTAIIAGFLISFLGGSKVQIGGPTGAFVVVVYAVIQKHGYDGLALATMIAGGLIVLMGLARLGSLLKYIPDPVTIGFTTGIAVVIFISQVKDIFGLDIEKVPPEFIEKCIIFCKTAHTFNIWSIVVSVGTLSSIFLLRKYLPRLPGAILAIGLATLISYFFHLPLETIESKFGEIPRMLPTPSLPDFSFEKIQSVFPDAVTIALLGAIESLLSAMVADRMTGDKHSPNMELIAQGFANIGAIIFGGIPATGAIARTSANIRLGAQTPLAGMVHAATLLLLMFALAPLASQIPLAALSGVLVFVAWNMSELPHFIDIAKGQKGDALILVATFLLTVLIDLTVAVQIGVILASLIFLKRMTDATTIQVTQTSKEEKEIVVFEMNGPLFYGVAELLEENLNKLEKMPDMLMLCLKKAPLIDATGFNALKKFHLKCRQNEIDLLITEESRQKHKMLEELAPSLQK